jgi:hypothetical protein
MQRWEIQTGKTVKNHYSHLMQSHWNALCARWYLRIKICFYIIHRRSIEKEISKCQKFKKRRKSRELWWRLRSVQNVSKDSRLRSCLNIWKMTILCELSYSVFTDIRSILLLKTLWSRDNQKQV